MGTNYYVHQARCACPCAHCSQKTNIHLGKSSAGWRFLHWANDSWPRDEAPEKWMELVKSGPIRDEYDRPISMEELLSIIANSSSGKAHPTNRPFSFRCGKLDFSRGEFC